MFAQIISSKIGTSGQFRNKDRKLSASQGWKIERKEHGTTESLRRSAWLPTVANVAHVRRAHLCFRRLYESGEADPQSLTKAEDIDHRDASLRHIRRESSEPP